MPLGVILGLHWDYMGDNGKEHRNYYNGFYRVQNMGYMGILVQYTQSHVLST